MTDQNKEGNSPEEKRPPQAAGGVARAAALTRKQRHEIAKRAADLRWLPQATNQGKLRLADSEIPCFVLEDGRRVLSQSGMSKTLHMSKGGTRGVSGDRVANFLAGKRLSPFLSTRLTTITNLVIRFRLPQGGAVANGYEATILADICEAVSAARRAGALGPNQIHIADQCEVLIRAFAKVGIIGLVDEATGYQGVRPRDALQKYLELILRKELAAWSKRFPDEFYENIYKLRGWFWPGMSKNRYSVVAQYTRDLVYERIAPQLLQELEARSPKNEKGERKNKLHQWLTDDVGHPLLAQHLHSLILFQRLAIANRHGWKRFVRTVDQVLPKKGANLELALGDGSWSGQSQPGLGTEGVD